MTEQEIFTAALTREDRVERAAFLDEACAGNAPLRQRVESLLAEHLQLGSFMDVSSPAQASGAAVARTIDMPDEPAVTAAPGTVIGPYKLLQQIGEGGMGVVYMAEQAAPVRRKVALKIIKPGMDTREVIARFEAERQALALMDHPNIARVFDAGATAAGRPYFVMELVRGVPLTDYCDQNNLPVHERLELFIIVCHAVQHAHQKGIIHRDIKPSNVLVTLHDGRPVPKVIDFGVAKAIGQQLTDKTLFTQFAQMVGTPLYMSPEQAQMTGQDVDTRGDIYSLGVLLYELLTGTTPFESGRMKQAAMEEIRRMIREEEPPSPSTRLSSTAGESQTAVAAHRRVDPKGLSRLVRGDLDWIVMKALEKDRNRRYETANGFAADIGRYLSDEPVEACPPSAAYRFRKFARRNRAGLVTAGLLGVALLVTTSTIGWTIRDRSAQQAEMERQRVAQQLETERERAAARQQVEQERLVRQAKLGERISQALEETKVGYERDRLPEALTAVKRAEALLASDNGVSVELRKRVDQSRAELRILERLEELGFQFSREGSRETDAAYSKVFLDIGINIDELPIEEAGQRIRSHLTWQRLTEALDRWTGIRHELAWLEKSSADANRSVATEVAERGFLRKIRLLQVARAADADDLRSQARLAVETWDIKAALRLAESPEVTQLPASTLRQLAMLIYFGEGDSHRQRAVQLLENARVQRPGDFQLAMACATYYWRMDPPRWAEVAHYFSIAIALRPDDARVQSLLAFAYSRQGKVDEALAAYRKAIELNPDDGASHGRLGNVLHDQKKLDEAIAHYRKAIELDPHLSGHRYNLGLALRAQGHWDEALVAYSKAIELDRKYFSAWINRGGVYEKLDQLDKALADYTKAIELDPKSSVAWISRGVVYKKLGQLDKALADSSKAIELDPKVAMAWNNRGVVYEKLGQLDEAIADYTKAIELDQTWAMAWTNRGGVFANLGQVDKALADYFEAIELDPTDAKARSNRGVVYGKLAQWDKAIADYTKVIEQDPTDAKAWANRGLGYENLGQVDKALADLSKAIELDPMYATAWANRGWAYSKLGQLDKALAEFSKAIELDPTSANAWNNRGVVYARLGQMDKAVADSSKAIELDPSNAGAWNNRGGDYAELGEVDKALADYSKAIELGPKLVKHWINRGLLYEELRQVDKALADYSTAIELDPKFAPAWYARGTGYLKLDQPDEALADLSESINLDPEDAKAWSNRGAVYKKLGQVDRSIAEYSKAIELDPKFVGAWTNRGNACMGLGEWAKAAADFARIVELEPQNGGVRHKLAGCSVQLGRYQEALDGYRQLVEDFPKAALPRNDMAWLLATCPEAKLRDPGRAVELAKKAVELTPKEGGYWNTLGVAHYRASDWQGSVAALQKSMELRQGGDAFDYLFLALSHWQLGNKDEARTWYDRGVTWIEKNRTGLDNDKQHDEELKRFRAEAEELLK